MLKHFHTQINEVNKSQLNADKHATVSLSDWTQVPFKPNNKVNNNVTYSTCN